MLIKSRVVVAANHWMVRRLVVEFVRADEDLILVADGGSWADAARLCARLRPDFLIVDGLPVAEEDKRSWEGIRQSCPSTRALRICFRDGERQGELTSRFDIEDFVVDQPDLATFQDAVAGAVAGHVA